MWDWAVWGALIAAALPGMCAFALLARSALSAWRAFRDVRRHTVDTLGDLAAKAELTAEKAGTFGDTPELEASLARLRVSLARLAVLRAALDEANLGRITAVVSLK